MDIQCTQIIKKIKIATGKVLWYTRALKKKTQMDYRLRIALMIWRAIVLVQYTGLITRGIVAFNFSPRNLTQVTSAMKPE